MTTFKGFATPIDIQILGQPLGDHTWVASDESGVCWNALGGGPTYYCGPNRWHGGTYVPPEGHQICSGDGDVASATCMGNPKTSTFMQIPSSAGIVYAINGVCHQIANRVLYWTGATVEAASGYWFTSTTFGTWGTTVPPAAYNPVIVGPAVAAVAVAYEASVLWDWWTRTSNCKPATLRAPQPQSAHAAKVLALLEGARPLAPSSRADRVKLHLQEVQLTLTHRLGPQADSAAVAAVTELFAQRYVQVAAPPSAPAPAAGGAIDAKLLAQRFNEDASRFYSTVAEKLGAAAYRQVFDAEPGAYVGLINPESLASRGP